MTNEILEKMYRSLTNYEANDTTSYQLFENLKIEGKISYLASAIALLMQIELEKRRENSHENKTT